MGSGRRLKHWGWGYEDQQPGPTELAEAAVAVRERLGFGGEPVPPVPEDEIELRPSRLKPAIGPEGLFSDERHDRLVHGLGKAYRDVVRGYRGSFENPPDLVAFPGTAEEVAQVLSVAADAGAVVIPFGGGTSVVGGVEPRLPEGDDRPVVSLDLTGLDRVLELDRESLAAKIQAGVRGPALEDQLKAEGLTLRHYPQSFEYSTLGGWIATRAGGHFATGETHIDDLVESVTALSPTGEWQSRRLPGSGAGPSPDRLLIGSEGTLGVITEAWVRVRPRPSFRASATVTFPDFTTAATGAVREIVQARLNPGNCRLIDPGEAETMMAGDGQSALLLLGFESDSFPVGDRLDQAIEIARAHGGTLASRRESGADGDEGSRESRESRESSMQSGADLWRGAFLMAPYLRDTLVACGVLSETFETAITWDRFESFVTTVIEETREAVRRVSPDQGEPRVTCRLTHVYPDGAAPYFTVLAPAVRGGEVEQWDEVKAAASEAILGAGGTITHHHAIGRDHRPWYDLQRPDPFADALAGAKRGVDPAGMLNPGVLIDPLGP